MILRASTTLDVCSRAMALLLVFVALAAAAQPVGYAPATGDIIFQQSRFDRDEAIRIATRSRFSHVGIVLARPEGPVVFEAGAVVRETPLDAWIGRGVDGRFAIKRLKRDEDALTSKSADALLAVSRRWKGIADDRAFEWSDEALYCSELVWKAYREGVGVELCAIEKMGDFDLANPLVRAKIAAEWERTPSLDAPVVSPEGLWRSKLLETVTDRGAPAAPGAGRRGDP